MVVTQLTEQLILTREDPGLNQSNQLYRTHSKLPLGNSSNGPEFVKEMRVCGIQMNFSKINFLQLNRE